MGPEYQPTSIDRELEKHWGHLTFLERAVVLHDIGIKEDNKFHMGGKTIEEILRMNQEDLPGEIRGRLILAVTENGFSKEEYERVKAETRRIASSRG